MSSVKTAEMIAKEFYDRKWDRFIEEYPTAEARRTTALKLLPGKTRPELTHATHSVLVSQWGDSGTQLRATLEDLYRRNAAVNGHVGQMAVIFTKGRLKDVSSAESKFLANNIKLTFGTVAEGDFAYNFADTNPEIIDRNPALLPLLNFAVEMRLRRSQTLKVRQTDGAITITANPMIGQPRYKPLYSGSVSLDPNMKLYDQERDIQPRDMLFGDEKSHKLLMTVAAIAGGVAWENFQALADQGVIREGVVLPKLADIFSEVPVA